MAQAKAAEAEALPGLRQELATARAEGERLAERGQQLEQAGADLRSQLAEARATAEAATAEAAETQRSTDELAAAHAVVQQQLRGEVAELQVRATCCLLGGHPDCDMRLSALALLDRQRPNPFHPIAHCRARWPSWSRSCRPRRQLLRQHVARSRQLRLPLPSSSSGRRLMWQHWWRTMPRRRPPCGSS